MNYIYSMGFMNYCSHDPGCALIRSDGKELDMIFAEEGFLSRRKKSYHFPIRSMKYCLDYFGIKLNRVDIIMLDFMDHQRTFRTSDNYRLLLGDYIRSRLKIDDQKIRFCKSHHYAHAMTAFWPSGFADAAVLVVDGLGSQQQTHSVYRMDSKGSSALIYEQKGVGIGTLYTLATRALGFESGEEGKTMGLAPYGAAYRQFDKKLPDLRGTYEGLRIDHSAQIDRNPNPALRFSLPKPKSKKELYRPLFCRFAYNLQKETEKSLCHLAIEAVKAAKSDHLCFAGGVALNCVANNKIRHLKSIKNLFIQPAAGDTGIPIGLAISGLEQAGISLAKLMTPENRKKLAVPYSQDKKPLERQTSSLLKKVLNSQNIKAGKFCEEKIAQDLAKGKVVALFTEGIEIGPRALGHRSFLADARTAKMKEVMNAKIKHREGYRPFAPAVLSEHFSDYFISKMPHQPYMLEAPQCTPKAIQKIPAVCHVDGSARAMTTSKETGKITNILSSYFKMTSIPVLINTSFNDNNEPICFTKLDALCCFLRCNADTLILENKILERKQIQNNKKLLKHAENEQKNFQKNYFLRALRELTYITAKNEKDLYRFCALNNKLSQFYQKERMHKKLLDFLLSRNPEKPLWVDQYHSDILKEISQLFGISLKKYCPKIILVQDNVKAFKKISPGSDFILYNVSGFYFEVNVNKNQRPTLNACSFYDLNDKKLGPISQNNFIQKEKNIKVLLKSYEVDLKKSIDNFFRRI
ncbi:MAG: hypothetical protein KGQ54_00920 [Verrucomicrobia bacterium]|nr:hypothetical protein [Verrucomicrobiota bacterium]